MLRHLEKRKLLEVRKSHSRRVAQFHLERVVLRTDFLFSNERQRSWESQSSQSTAGWHYLISSVCFREKLHIVVLSANGIRVRSPTPYTRDMLGRSHTLRYIRLSLVVGSLLANHMAPIANERQEGGATSWPRRGGALSLHKRPKNSSHCFSSPSLHRITYPQLTNDGRWCLVLTYAYSYLQSDNVFEY